MTERYQQKPTSLITRFASTRFTRRHAEFHRREQILRRERRDRSPARTGIGGDGGDRAAEGQDENARSHAPILPPHRTSAPLIACG